MWRYHVQQFSEASLPTCFDMSLDFLPIQASAVPSKRVFSSSAEMDTKKRNRINPVLMEALQTLKFTLKQSRLNFTKDWATPKSDLLEQEPDIGEDLLADLLGHDSEDIIDRIIQDSNKIWTVPSSTLLLVHNVLFSFCCFYAHYSLAPYHSSDVLGFFYYIVDLSWNVFHTGSLSMDFAYLRVKIIYPIEKRQPTATRFPPAVKFNVQPMFNLHSTCT